MLLDGPERPGHCRAALQNARTARTPGTARTAHESCSGPSARPTHPDWTPPMNGRRLPAVTAAVAALTLVGTLAGLYPTEASAAATTAVTVTVNPRAAGPLVPGTALGVN